MRAKPIIPTRQNVFLIQKKYKKKKIWFNSLHSPDTDDIIQMRSTEKKNENKLASLASKFLSTNSIDEVLGGRNHQINYGWLITLGCGKSLANVFTKKKKAWNGHYREQTFCEFFFSLPIHDRKMIPNLIFSEKSFFFFKPEDAIEPHHKAKLWLKTDKIKRHVSSI